MLIDPRAEFWRSKKLFTFLQAVFPCAQYLFNLRTDVKAQAFAQAYQNDNVQPEELQAVNDDAVARTESLGNIRSRLIYLDDFNNISYNSVAHWLGHQDCSFLALPEVDLRDWATNDRPSSAKASCGQPIAVAASSGPQALNAAVALPANSDAEASSFMSKAPRVYMMPLSDAWSKEMLSCPPADSRWHRSTFPFGKEQADGPTHSENDLEMWYHDAMKHYSHLTSNPLEADLIYVPAYGRRADVCSRTEEQRTALHKELAEHILNYHVWYPNSTIFMPYGAVCSCKNSPCSPLKGESSTLYRKLHIMAYEAGAPNDNGPPNVVVPQLVFTATSERARVVKQLNTRWSGKQQPSNVRHTLVLNTAAVEPHPNTCLHCGACSASDALTEKGQCTPGCSNIRERLRMHIISNYGNDTLVKNIAAEAGATVDSPVGEGSRVDGSLAAMAGATFCLQPGGQTLTRAAFYQSIVYGCIPVVFREDFHFLHTLAFSETIPYRQLWVHIPETSVMAGEDFVKTLKAIPQETIAAKRKLMRTYAPMLDWNCGIKEGCDTSSTSFQATLVASLNSARHVGLQFATEMERERLQLVRTKAADAGEKKCTGPLGEKVECTDNLWPPEEPEYLRHWPPEEIQADVKKAELQIKELKEEAGKADALSKELTKEAVAAKVAAKVPEKKCKDYAGNPIWCDGSAVASPSPLPKATEKKCKDYAGNPIWCDGSAVTSPLPLPKAAEKKCKDYAGNPIWCDGSAIASPSPLPKTTVKKLQKEGTVAGPEKLCTNTAGQPIWCDGLTPEEVESLKKKIARQALASPSPSPSVPQKSCTNDAGEPVWCADGAMPSPSPSPSAEDIVADEEATLQRAMAAARAEHEEEKRLKWEEDAKKCWDDDGIKQWCSLLPKHASEARQMVKYARMQRMAREAKLKAAAAVAAKAAAKAKASAAKALASKKKALASAAKAKAEAEAKARAAEAKAKVAEAKASAAEAKEAREAKAKAAVAKAAAAKSAAKDALQAREAAWKAVADASTAAFDEKARLHDEEVQFREDAAAKVAADLANAARAMEARILGEEINIAKGATGWASDPEGGAPAPWGGRELSQEGAARIVDPGFEPELKVEQVPSLLSELNLEDAAVVEKMRIKAGTAKLHAEVSEPEKLEAIPAHKLKGGKGHSHKGKTSTAQHRVATAKLHAERQDAGTPPPSHMEAAKYQYEEKEAARRRLQQAIDAGGLDSIKIAIGHSAAAAEGTGVLQEARTLRDRLEEKLRKGEAVATAAPAPRMVAATAATPQADASATAKKQPAHTQLKKEPAAELPAKKCRNDAGEPTFCNGTQEREAADAKDAALRARKHEEEVKAREAAEKIRSERAVAEAGAKIKAAEAQKDTVVAAKKALVDRAEAEHAAKAKAHEAEVAAREAATAKAKAMKAEATAHAEKVKQHEEDLRARAASEKARKAKMEEEAAEAKAEEAAAAKERSDVHKAEVEGDAKARAENKQRKLMEDKESREISNKKQSEYNLRVSAAKVYKEEGTRRARAEKQARSNRGHWFYQEKKARAEAESAAQLLKGTKREKAKIVEHRRRETTKDEERKREKAEATVEAEARRKAQAVEAEADGRAERAKTDMEAAVAAREQRRAAEAKARAEAKALEPEPSPEPMPTFGTKAEKEAWEEKRRAHGEEAAAREAAAKVLEGRADAEHAEKVKAHEAEVAAREAAALKVATSTRPQANLQLLERPRVSHRQALAILGRLKMNR